MYKGLIDEVMICNYGLTSSEIVDIFNETNQSMLKNLEITEDVNVKVPLLDDINNVISTEKIYLVNGVSDIAQIPDFMLYPNPAHSFVNIVFELMPGKESTIELIDEIGRVILSKKVESLNFRIELNGYSSGIYYLRFKNDKLQKTKKLIIKG